MAGASAATLWSRRLLMHRARYALFLVAFGCTTLTSKLSPHSTATSRTALSSSSTPAAATTTAERSSTSAAPASTPASTPIAGGAKAAGGEDTRDIPDEVVAI